MNGKKGHKTKLEKYGREQLRQWSSKGGATGTTNWHFTDSEKARAAVNRRWAKVKEAQNAESGQ